MSPISSPPLGTLTPTIHLVKQELEPNAFKSDAEQTKQQGQGLADT